MTEELERAFIEATGLTPPPTRSWENEMTTSVKGWTPLDLASYGEFIARAMARPGLDTYDLPVVVGGETDHGLVPVARFQVRLKGRPPLDIEIREHRP